MPRHEFAKEARAALLDELHRAGFPDARLESAPGVCWVTTTATRAAIQPTVDAHDATALDVAEAQELTRFQQDVGTLKTFLGTANTAITQAMVIAALKAVIRILRRVVHELRD
jgi:uncharacterized protein Smg (DUF494 family)